MATCFGSDTRLFNLIIKLQKNKNLHGQVFNFGPKNNQNKTVIQLVKEIRKNWKEISWKVNKTKKAEYFNQIY